METVRPYRIPLPKNKHGHDFIDCEGVLVIVGANGAGKTRLGVWLEKTTPEKTHRVSAQKSLSFPAEAHAIDFQSAERRLRFGDPRTDVSDLNWLRSASRWSQKPETAQLNDYDKLVVYLLSEEFKHSVSYRQRKAAGEECEPPETKLDIIRRIWNFVLPRRELLVDGGRIEARQRGQGTAYSATNLSDGERVIFYLIGEALSVPQNGVFIVDEPELHLHRAVQAKLWDAIEAERPDCLFIYLTHDLDFAASRKDQTKIWIQDYSEGKWDWEALPKDSPFPEAVFLELLGSRNPILFTEGEKGSLDYFLYGKLLPDWTIVPCGSCEAVIHATKSFNAMCHLHKNTCRGIIDSDARTEEELAKLRAGGVDILPFAEIENLLLIEPLLRLAAQWMCIDKEEAISGAQRRVLELLSRDREDVVSQLCARELEGAFRQFDSKAKGEAALADSFQNVCKLVDSSKVYQKWDAEIGDVINSADYGRALRHYSNKGLSSQLGGVFKTSLRELILRKLRSREATPIIAAMHEVILPLLNV